MSRAHQNRRASDLPDDDPTTARTSAILAGSTRTSGLEALDVPQTMTTVIDGILGALLTVVHYDARHDWSGEPTNELAQA
jgi:hypothetical protein